MTQELSFAILIGLGNPEKKYENTFHNAGLLFVRYLAQQKNAPAMQAPKGRAFSYVKLESAILAESLVFMNESGAAAEDALSYFKIAPEMLAVAHDDTDLPLGTWKIENNRGTAGHKGVESVAGALKTKNFARIRIGVRPPELSGQRAETRPENAGVPAAARPRAKAGDFVLCPMNREQKKILEKAFGEIAEKISGFSG